MGNIRFQVAAILILTIIVIVYGRSKKLPLVSTRWFSILLVSACVNMVFDIITIHTIIYLESVGPTINRLCHQLFIGTLNISLVCLYFYIDYLGKQEQRCSIIQIIGRMVPCFIAIIFVIFGKLYYRNEGNMVYSYGPMVNALYVSCFTYVVASIATTIKYRKVISKERVISVYAGIAVWVLAAIIQFIAKDFLISGLALSLLVLIIYLSFENPREYLDEQTKSFNSLAYQKMLAQAFGRRKGFCVVNISVEEYTTIHRMFGQEVANEMLATISSYVQQTLHMRVYHPSANHLVIIMDKHGECCESIVDQVSIIQKRFEESWSFGTSFYHLEPRITMVECPKFAKDEKELHDILHFMGNQRNIGTMGVRTVNPYILEQRIRNNKIADLVEQAINEDMITMLYQPIYSVKDKAFVSAEALVRLTNTGDLGFVSPEEFIPIAEEKGFIMELGACIFEKVCEFISRSEVHKLGVQYIEVNLSAIQCMDSDLPGQLKSIMSKYNIPPSFINLEITETTAIESGELLAKNMKKLTDMGCSFSMDDFGTGYSNLSKIAEINYDLIKLDKSLIWPCFEENGYKANVILSNIISMINHLHIRIVAEGVETVEQVERLSELHVDYLQGYYYSRPIKGEEYLEFLRKNVV